MNVAQEPRHRAGERCSTRARLGKYAQRDGCRGRLVVVGYVPARSGQGWVPAGDGQTPERYGLECSRCGQAHGPAPEPQVGS